MEQSPEQIRDAIRQVMELELDALVEWMKTTPTPNLSEIEERVLKFRQVMSEKATEAVVQGQAARVPVEAQCPQCGGAAVNKGLKKVRRQTSCGEVEVARSYWYCPPCKQGFFPPR